MGFYVSLLQRTISIFNWYPVQFGGYFKADQGRALCRALSKRHPFHVFLMEHFILQPTGDALPGSRALSCFSLSRAQAAAVLRQVPHRHPAAIMGVVSAHCRKRRRFGSDLQRRGRDIIVFRKPSQKKDPVPKGTGSFFFVHAVFHSAVSWDLHLCEKRPAPQSSRRP